jgi:predicted nucleic acid-binding protein
MILVDASIWIDFFRCANYRAELETLLHNRQLATHPCLIAELALGSLANRQQTLAELDSLPSLITVSMEDVRLMIEARGLYAKGIGFVDANLLASCLATPGAKIWTLDTRLGKAADTLGIRADSRLLVN